MAAILRRTCSRLGVKMWMTRIFVSGVLLVMCWYHGYMYGQSAIVSQTDHPHVARDVLDHPATHNVDVNNSIYHSVDVYRKEPQITRSQEQPHIGNVETQTNISNTKIQDFVNPRTNLSHVVSPTMTTKNETDPPVQVIIVTKMRSGSSFTGEIFNRNDDFVYYFEPLNEMKLDRGDKMASFMGKNRESVLNDIMKCNFSNFKTFNWWNGRRPRQQCSFSTAYQASSICNSQIQRGMKVESLSNTAVLKNEAICQSHKHVAIKTVRIPDIGTLKGLMTDTSLNVKIIHLVRDPRATSNSKQDIHDPDNPNVECKKMENNLKYWLDPPDWIRGRYMLLRYEDLAERPHYILDAVYNFLNLTAPSTVGKWFDLNTKGNDNTRDKWSHTRQSNKTAHAWRTHLHIKFDKLLKAQRDCAKVMDLLGYRAVRSNVELRDTVHVSTLHRHPYPLLPNTTNILGR